MNMDKLNDLNNDELEMIKKGKEHWSLDILHNRRGGFVDSSTIIELIDKVIENTWTEAKKFYKNK